MTESIGTSQMTGEPIFIRGIQADRAAMSSASANGGKDGEA